MTPADAAAYAALDLPPGAAWPVVQDAWRRLVKRHHPDAGAGTAFDARRVREANAAYAHLRASAAAAGGRLVRRRHAAATRRAVWDALWSVEEWPCWMPGVRSARAVVGASDRRVALSGRWGGHRIGATLVLMTIMPPCRLSGRVLDLRLDGEPVPVAPPRVWARVDVVADGAAVELGVALPDGSALPPVLVAALDAALVELVEAAAP